MNMFIRMIILKWILKTLVLFLDWILNEFILHKNNKYVKYFAIKTFWGHIQIQDFSWMFSLNFSKHLYGKFMFKNVEHTFIYIKLITSCWIKIKQ